MNQVCRTLITVILAIFLLVGGGIYYTRHAATTPASEAADEPVPPPKPAPAVKEKASPLPKPAAQRYDLIARRNLFRPIVPPRVSAPSPETKAPPSPPNIPPTPPIAPPPAAPNPLPTHTPEKDNIAVVGVVSVNGVRQALLEDVGRGDSRAVREGEVAFGYIIKQILSDGAVLEREQTEFRLALGENKPERNAPRNAVVTSATQQGASTVYTFSSGVRATVTPLTPEQIQDRLRQLQSPRPPQPPTDEQGSGGQ